MISPCVKVCKIASDTNICIGCFRTLEEIGKWSQLTDTERLAIIDKLKKRKKDNYNEG